MIFSLLALKGGQGKTSISLNLAAEYVKKGFKVALVDADQQQSLYDFCFHRREMGEKVEQIDCFLYRDFEMLQTVQYNYDLVIIDNSPRINNIIDEILSISDLVIIPTKLDKFSYWANVELVKKLKAMNKQNSAVFLLNQVEHHQSKLKNEFKEGLAELGLPIFKQALSKSNDYVKSQNDLKTLREINSKKVAEIQLVMKEIEEL